jgi:hypothetical protein
MLLRDLKGLDEEIGQEYTEPNISMEIIAEKRL